MCRRLSRCVLEKMKGTAFFGLCVCYAKKKIERRRRERNKNWMLFFFDPFAYLNHLCAGFGVSWSHFWITERCRRRGGTSVVPQNTVIIRHMAEKLTRTNHGLGFLGCDYTRWKEDLISNNIGLLRFRPGPGEMKRPQRCGPHTDLASCSWLFSRKKNKLTMAIILWFDVYLAKINNQRKNEKCGFG